MRPGASWSRAFVPGFHYWHQQFNEPRQPSTAWRCLRNEPMRASVQSETVWPQIKMETLKIRQVILRFESSFPGLGERTRAGWLGTGYERTAQAPTARRLPDHHCRIESFDLGRHSSCRDQRPPETIICHGLERSVRRLIWRIDVGYQCDGAVLRKHHAMCPEAFRALQIQW